MTPFYVYPMVSDQCMDTVQKISKALQLCITHLSPGYAEVEGSLSEVDISQIERALKKAGFHCIQDEQEGMINRIKCAVKRLVHHRKTGENMPSNIKSALSNLVGGIPYAEINRLFIAQEGQTIREYAIHERITRAKILLKEDWMRYNTTDISIDLGYNSPSNFCEDFKRITGITLTHYRAVGLPDRKSPTFPTAALR